MMRTKVADYIESRNYESSSKPDLVTADPYKQQKQTTNQSENGQRETCCSFGRKASITDSLQAVCYKSNNDVLIPDVYYLKWFAHYN